MLHNPVMARPMDWMPRCHIRRLVNCWLLIDWRRWGRISHIGSWIIIGGCSVKAKGRKAEPDAEPAAMAPTAMSPATVAPAAAPTPVAPATVAPAAPTTREGRV
jgi:hypothetical protein